MASLKSRLTDPEPKPPRCTCFRHLGKVIACQHHREPVKAPGVEDITVAGIPDLGHVYREEHSVTGDEPWMSDDKTWRTWP